MTLVEARQLANALMPRVPGLKRHGWAFDGDELSLGYDLRGDRWKVRHLPRSYDGTTVWLTISFNEMTVEVSTLANGTTVGQPSWKFSMASPKFKIELADAMVQMAKEVLRLSN